MLLDRRQRALDKIAAASKGSASVLAKTWKQESNALAKAVDGEYLLQVKRMKPTEDQIARYAKVARERSRRVAASIADESKGVYRRRLASTTQ